MGVHGNHMALTGKHTTPDGVEHLTTYARIIEANLNFHQWYGRIVLGLWHDQAAYEAGRQMIGQCAVDLSTTSTQEQPPERPGQPRRPSVQSMPPAEELLAPLKQTFGAELYEFVKTRFDVGGIDFTQWNNA